MAEMMMRVRAVGTGKLPVPGMTGRFVGRTKAGEIIAEGVDVPEDGYHLRALTRGDIELVQVAKANPAKGEVKQ